jgi:glycosyltransferase involved in cell wall biosynthesis
MFSEFYFTIIIPHKNTPELLLRCIESIPKSPKIQIIIIDDNSEFYNANIFNAISSTNPFIQIFKLKESKGAGYARNFGLKNAKGKWILFADADDFYSNNLNILLNDYYNSEDEIIFFKTSSYNENNYNKNHRSKSNNIPINLWLNNIYSNEDLLFATVVPWNKMIKKDFLLNYNIQFEEILAANDLLFSKKCAIFAKKVKAIDLDVYFVTYTENSLSTVLTKEKHYSRFLCGLTTNDFLIYNGYGHRISSIMYELLRSRHFGLKYMIKCFQIVLKSNTPIFTGYKNWIKTFFKLIFNTDYNVQHF